MNYKNIYKDYLMEKTASLKERLRARALAKKQEQVVKQLESEAIRIQREKEYEKFIAENPNFLESTFSLDDKQEKSSVRDPNVLSASQKKRAKKKAKKQQMKEKNEKKMINDSNNA